MEKQYENVKDLIQDLLDFKCVIYTPTESQAEEFITTMKDKYNMGWENGSYYTYYTKFKKRTCYSFEYGKNNMDFCSTTYYNTKRNLHIVPYKNIKELL